MSEDGMRWSGRAEGLTKANGGCNGRQHSGGLAPVAAHGTVTSMESGRWFAR